MTEADNVCVWFMIDWVARPFLVVSPVTDASEHLKWLGPMERNFDLLLVYCGNGEKEDVFKKSSEYFLKTEGKYKLENVAVAIDKFESIFSRYQAIWLPDDDIVTDSETINSFFEKFAKSKYKLAQPALTWWKGQINYQVFVQRKEYFLREVNFIEMMAPVFRTELLLSKPIRDTLVLNRSGWGVDLVWAKLLGFEGMAIFDEICVTHKPKWKGRFSESRYYSSLEKKGVDWNGEFEKVRTDYGVGVENIQIIKAYKRSIFVFVFGFFSSVLKRAFGKYVRIVYAYLIGRFL